MTLAGAAEVLDRFDVSRVSRDRIEIYVRLLLAWQSKINLIGPSTVPHVWERHICDALQLLPLLPASSRAIADLGSGAGIPGLVIAMAADIEVHLYESNGKKAAFLREAARLTATHAHVHTMRLETLVCSKDVPVVQCVTARALAPLALLVQYAEPFLMKGATALFHKGQDVDIELTEATKYWKIQNLRHPSQCDPRGVVLEIREVSRV